LPVQEVVRLHGVEQGYINTQYDSSIEHGKIGYITAEILLDGVVTKTSTRESDYCIASAAELVP
jgi:hypothetical protein